MQGDDLGVDSPETARQLPSSSPIDAPEKKHLLRHDHNDTPPGHCNVISWECASRLHHVLTKSFLHFIL